MFEITVESAFAAAHRLREYDGNCEHLHGHNWQVELTVAADELDGLGLAVDFRRVREWLSRALSRFDHAYLNELPDFSTRNPSCELIAKSIFDMIHQTVDSSDLAKRITVSRVRVWESPGSSVTYRRE
ncbi:6-carboxytetrahydropterin synthase QueD [bacterium]|nr:6-carboxytetrahydropterin synthase QueD [candidate division CSSED10-310 bacterium]